ncbi:hypothetical protein, partial [Neisseria sp. P0014.S002]|uniref:hypothetical protein n=1 Tax=Neisseria sp. P0014.S002 TaxID=3436748 RepID=UPI003F7D8B23
VFFMFDGFFGFCVGVAGLFLPGGWAVVLIFGGWGFRFFFFYKKRGGGLLVAPRRTKKKSPARGGTQTQQV